MPKQQRLHSLQVRLSHWLNLAAMVCMFMSGWEIYNASPLFNFRFPAQMTLGGWLGGGIAWHLAVMWVLGINGLIYLVWNLASGHLRHDILSFSLPQLAHDIWLALTFRLKHAKGDSYNAIQKCFYTLVIIASILLVLSGLSIWKPVQLSPLTSLFGGFEIARYVHFFCMAFIALFTVIHVIMALSVPRTLLDMITGGRRERL